MLKYNLIEVCSENIVFLYQRVLTGKPDRSRSSINAKMYRSSAECLIISPFEFFQPFFRYASAQRVRPGIRDESNAGRKTKEVFTVKSVVRVRSNQQRPS